MINTTSLARFVPPVVTDYLLRRRSPVKFYDSYEAALADADSYEDPLLTELVAAKGKQFVETLQSTNELDYSHLRILLALVGSRNSQPLRVLDFGGGSGTHYWVAKKILGSDLELDWRVVETPAMVEAVTRYELANEELRFYSDIQEAVSDVTFEAVYASSSVHYTPDPYATLETLCSIPSRRLIVTRTPMADRDIVLLQTSRMRDNGPGPVPALMTAAVAQRVVTYPVWVLNRHKLRELLTRHGSLDFEISEGQVLLGSFGSKFEMYGTALNLSSSVSTELRGR